MKNRKLYLIPLIIFTIGIIIGSFFDYQINSAVYVKYNAFGMGFAAFGPFFGYAFFVFFAGLVHRFAIKETKLWVKIELFVLSTFGIVASTYLSSGEVTSINGFNIPQWRWLIAIGLAILFIPFFIFGDKYGKKTDDKAILYAFLILVGFMVIDLVPIAQIIKNTMRRPRFRIIVDDSHGIQATFKNWWERFSDYASLKEANPNVASFSEQFKSFPSGHTSVAAILLFGLPYLPLVIPKLKGKENLLFVIGFVYTLLMAFSRMTVGAHFLTDVSFGALFMTVCSIAANEINLKFFIKENNNVELN